jgi:ATP-dependent Lon protease
LAEQDIPADSVGNMSPEDWASLLAAGLPVIPLRDIILFPGTVAPILLGRPQSLSALMRALESSRQLAFFSLQKTASEDEVRPETLKPVGVVGRIASSQSLPNNLSKVLVEAVAPARAEEWRVSPNLIEAVLQPLAAASGDAQPLLRRIDTARVLFADYLGQNTDLPRGVGDLIDALPGPEEKLYAMAGHLKLPVGMKQLLIEEPTMDRKLDLILEFLRNEMDTAALGRRLEHEVRAGIAQSQREYYLGEQLRKIQSELGSFSPPLNQENRQLEERIQAKGLPPKALERVMAEMKRLDYLNPSSPEYSVVRTYVDWFLALPWGQCTKDDLDLAVVKARLDQDHYGLKAVKERILEHVAVLKLSKHRATPILCLAGPPGVGKTSLGKSIALALGRAFVRISLGGVRDEAEIRGHRRTYIGSMPGRIVQALKKAQSMNPVILLDEIDKMGNDFRGDPSSALLEVLDPEQNSEFIDHFMEAGIDLSQVFFVTTANVEEQIPAALHDRLEVIRITGYFDSEKLAIAKQHLIPKLRAASGLTAKQFDFRDEVLGSLIRRYTREAGVRQLSRQLAKIARKRAREVVDLKEAVAADDGAVAFRAAGAQAKAGGKAVGKPGDKSGDIKAAKTGPGQGLPPLSRESLAGYLGVPVRQERMVPDAVRPGVVTGLAWTPAGGELLRVECTLLSGKGRLHLTGHLGEVMKESAQIALTLARERARRYGIDPEVFHKTDIHLHVPEGAIPKDGPSAGVAMTLALISAMTRRAVDPKIAFTGEISLVGRIHAIGGLPEKSLAALQAGVTRIVVPAENAPEVGELPPEAKAGLVISQAEHIDPVLKELLPAPLKGALKAPPKVAPKTAPKAGSPQADKAPQPRTTRPVPKPPAAAAKPPARGRRRNG